MGTATTARIRRIVRDVEYAISSDATVLTNRPDAKPQGADNTVLPSFWCLTADAQVLTAERFTILKNVRLHEAAESDTLLGIGGGIAIAPVLPSVRMRDPDRGLDRIMPIKGLAFDRNTERNSVEAIG